MSILFPSFAYAFCRVETLSRKPGTSWCGIRDLLTAQTRHWISFSSQGRQASPDIKAFFCWLCLMMLGGFGWIWDTLGVANNILERRNRRKIEVGSMSQSADTFSQSIFMVDNALGTSVSGPLPEGIEERCPKSWPWTKFCHESVYY